MFIPDPGFSDFSIPDTTEATKEVFQPFFCSIKFYKIEIIFEQVKKNQKH
jgi:hypothetical protein